MRVPALNIICFKYIFFFNNKLHFIKLLSFKQEQIFTYQITQVQILNDQFHQTQRQVFLKTQILNINESLFNT